jgi:hypothetical protein
VIPLVTRFIRVSRIVVPETRVCESVSLDTANGICSSTYFTPIKLLSIAVKMQSIMRDWYSKSPLLKACFRLQKRDIGSVMLSPSDFLVAFSLQVHRYTGLADDNGNFPQLFSSGLDDIAYLQGIVVPGSLVTKVDGFADEHPLPTVLDQLMEIYRHQIAQLTLERPCTFTVMKPKLLLNSAFRSYQWGEKMSFSRGRTSSGQSGQNYAMIDQYISTTASFFYFVLTSFGTPSTCTIALPPDRRLTPSSQRLTNGQ